MKPTAPTSRVWRDGSVIALSVENGAPRYHEVTGGGAYARARIAVDRLDALTDVERIAAFEAILDGRVQA